MTQGTRQSHAWRTLSKRVRQRAAALQLPCNHCGQPIDYTLPPTHRHSATADHQHALILGGELLPTIDDIPVLHRSCNSRKGRAEQAAAGRGTPLKNQAMHNMQPNDSRDSLTAPCSTPAEGGKARSPAPTGKKHAGMRISAVGQGPVCDVSTPFTAEPRTRPGNAGLPLHFPPPHPEAVGSHGDHAAAWMEARMAGDRNAEGEGLLWWQWLVVQRSQEYRADGSMCWPLALLKVMRQQGKSVLLRELAMWRAGNAHLFGEVQKVLHAARIAALADQEQSAARLWAESQGLAGSRRKADSFIEWPDGSYWHVMAMGAVWGQRVGLALLDEGWDLQPSAFWNGLWPAMAQRKCRQAWVFSASNEGDRGLMASMQASKFCLVMVWGASLDDDPSDEGVWHRVTPHMTAERLEGMRIACAAPGFRVEWLNVQPVLGVGGWLPEWGDCGAAAGSRAGGVAAVEVSQDRAVYGVAVAVRRDDGSVDVWTGSFPSLPGAVEWLERVAPNVVVVSIGLAGRVVGPWEESQGSVRTTRDATPVLRDLVVRGLLRHDHSPRVADELAAARVVDTESGEMLSAKRSPQPIPVLKAVAWAVHGATLPVVDEEPAVF